MRHKCLVAAVVAAFVASPIHAALISMSSTVVEVPTPTVFDTNFSTLNDGRAEIFFEVASHTVRPSYYPSNSPTEFAFDIATPGTYSSLPSGVGATVQAGWVISSWILHWAPLDHSLTEKTISGSVTFDRPILGISTQFVSDPYFQEAFQLPNIDLTGRSGGPQGGAEFCDPPIEPACDTVSLSTDGRTVSFNFSATLFSDDLRIFFLVPEPRSLSLLGIVAIPIAWSLRKQVIARKGR